MPVSDLTDAGLERIRKNLLDLMTRNRLLHFPTRATCLRVVDELPEHIFERLETGYSVVLREVPEPKIYDYGPGGQKPAAREHATKIGIAVSYDLPKPGKTTVITKAHSDKYIQTLHYAPELDGLCRRLGNAARTSIEESGTNMLSPGLRIAQLVRC